MAQNKLTDLRNHLFAALERLSDETLESDQMTLEIEKGKQVAALSNAIIGSAKIEIDFLKATGSLHTNTALFSEIQEDVMKRI